MNQLTLVREPDTGLEWLYVNDNQEYTGEPIYAEVWMSIINRFKIFGDVRTLNLTHALGERFDWNYNEIPKKLSEFIDGDFEK